MEEFYEYARYVRDHPTCSLLFLLMLHTIFSFISFLSLYFVSFDISWVLILDRVLFGDFAGFIGGIEWNGNKIVVDITGTK